MDGDVWDSVGMWIRMKGGKVILCGGWRGRVVGIYEDVMGER